MSQEHITDIVKSLIPRDVDRDAAEIVANLVFAGFVMHTVGLKVSYKSLMAALDEKARAPGGSCRKMLEDALFAPVPAAQTAGVPRYLDWLEREFAKVFADEN